MIGIFKQKNPANILFAFVLGLLLKLPVFMHARVPVIRDEDSEFYKTIIRFLSSFGTHSPVIFAWLTYALIFTQAIHLNKLINTHRMMNRPNFLPAASYLIITSLIPDWNYFSAPLLVNSLVIIVLNMLFNLYNQYQGKSVIFNIGLLVGLCSFIFFPSIILVVWLVLALVVMRTVRFNEWLICFLGVAAPYYFYAAYLFISGQWSGLKLTGLFQISLPSLHPSLWLAASGLLLIVPFLVGGYYVQENLRKMLIQVRKDWSLVLIYLFFTLSIPFLDLSTKGFESWILIAVPFAAFHACLYLYPVKRWFPLLIFWVTILFILAYQYYGPGW